jgi:hypothetical protein
LLNRRGWGPANEQTHSCHTPSPCWMPWTRSLQFNVASWV